MNKEQIKNKIMELLETQDKILTKDFSKKYNVNEKTVINCCWELGLDEK